MRSVAFIENEAGTILPMTITTFSSHFDNSIFHIAGSQHCDAQ